MEVLLTWAFSQLAVGAPDQSWNQNQTKERLGVTCNEWLQVFRQYVQTRKPKRANPQIPRLALLRGACRCPNLSRGRPSKTYRSRLPRPFAIRSTGSLLLVRSRWRCQRQQAAWRRGALADEPEQSHPPCGGARWSGRRSRQGARQSAPLRRR